MVDDDNSIEDDEYYFSEMGLSQDPSAPPSSAPSSSSNLYGGSVRGTGAERLSRKNIVIGIVIIVLAFVGYKLAGIFLHSRKNHETPVKHVQPAPAKHNDDSKMKASIDTALDNSKAMEQRLTQLHNENQSSIRTVQGKFSDLETHVSSLEEKTNYNHELLEQIKTHLIAQQAELQKLIDAHKKPKKKKKKSVMMVPQVDYNVKAVVPGRAWLQKDTDGSTITVSYGEKLPPYGWVRNIDLGRGLVFMSSGHIFSFAPDDR